MRTRSCLISIVALFASVHTVQAQAPSCQTVQFSDSVLERFPRVREACLDVIERQGQLLAVFKADLQRVTGNKARIRAKLPNGTRAAAQTVQVNPQRRVLVDGKSYRVSELALGQELTIYARVDEPVATLAPADANEPVELAPLESDPVRVASAEPAMPRTASALSAFGLGGGLLLCIAAALAFVRRTRSERFNFPA
jgi:hypothetical protein